MGREDIRQGSLRKFASKIRSDVQVVFATQPENLGSFVYELISPRILSLFITERMVNGRYKRGEKWEGVLMKAC